MRHGATDAEVQRVVAVIEEMGCRAHPMPGSQRTAVGLVGNDGRVDASWLEGLPGVQEVIQVTRPYKQVSREWQPDSTVVQLGGGVTIGGTDVAVIAGPCSVETERQILEAAHQVKEAGAVILRGGAWKPRTSPYAFQGLGRPGLKLLAKAREETGLLICTEAMDPEGLGYVAEVADIIQIGARRRRGGSGRHHGGGAPEPRQGPLRRRAVALPGPVRAADARGEGHRGGDRAPDRGAGVGRGVTPNADCGLRIAELKGQVRSRMPSSACDESPIHSAFRNPRSAILTIMIFAGPQAPDPWPVLDRASATYQSTSTLSADFVQIVENPLVGAPDTTRGKLYQMRPSRFAMRFAAPKGDRIVADGRYLWLYTPSTTPGQVIRAKIPAVGTTGPNLI